MQNCIVCTSDYVCSLRWVLVTALAFTVYLFLDILQCLWYVLLVELQVVVTKVQLHVAGAALLSRDRHPAMVAVSTDNDVVFQRILIVLTKKLPNGSITWWVFIVRSHSISLIAHSGWTRSWICCKWRHINVKRNMNVSHSHNLIRFKVWILKGWVLELKFTNKVTVGFTERH